MKKSSATRVILLCLHGWGGSKESFTELRKALNDTDIEILTPDLPGFGDEPEPTKTWTNDDYADWVRDWIGRNIGEKRFLLLGHSHGGRIAVKLAARHSLPITHLYLCAPAGIRRRQPVKRFVGLALAKTGKALLSLPILLNHAKPLARRVLYRLLRTHDYEQASPAMRQTMIRVTTEDMRPLLAGIHIPTDIFWGTDDRMTPYTDAVIVKNGIKGSVLHTYPGVTHRVHRDRAKEIASVIKRTMG